MLNIIRDLPDEFTPSSLPNLPRCLLLHTVETAELDGVQGELLEGPKVGSARHHADEGLVEVVAEGPSAPKARVVVRHDHRKVVREEIDSRMVPQVLDQFQHLVGDRTDLDGDLLLLDQLHELRVLQQGVTGESNSNRITDYNLCTGKNY